MYTHQLRKPKPPRKRRVAISYNIDRGPYMTEEVHMLTLLRIKAGTSQKELADKIGVTAKSICGWENGRVKPTPFNMECWRQVLCDWLKKDKVHDRQMRVY